MDIHTVVSLNEKLDSVASEKTVFNSKTEKHLLMQWFIYCTYWGYSPLEFAKELLAEEFNKSGNEEDLTGLINI